MLRHTWIAIPALAVAVLLALLAGAQDTRGAQPSLEELLQFDGMTQDQMAVELLRALDGPELAPPGCVPGQEMFDDVPASSPFCPFIEELARRGITSGCTNTQYCPGNPVTRAQMAVFIVGSMDACPTLDPTDEMIRVGGVCIDKYEASLWDAPVGGNQITGAIPCSVNGQDCTNIYARSVVGVEPRADITWFQAQAALRNSGKRLPTNAEWQMSALGTPDGFPCNVNSGGPVVTGSSPSCVSSAGVLDMVGNFWEWVADWDEEAAGCDNWPTTFGDDVTCIGRGDGDSTNRSPAPLVRGGGFASSSGAGPFAVFASRPTSFSFPDLGFRGAR